MNPNLTHIFLAKHMALINTSSGRRFYGTVGLTSPRGTYTRENLINCARYWLNAQSQNGLPCIGFTVSQEKTLMYNAGEGVVEEPVVTIAGEIVSHLDKHSDTEVLEALLSLFSTLAVAMKQWSVRFLYTGYGDIHHSRRLCFPPDKFYPTGTESVISDTKGV